MNRNPRTELHMENTEIRKRSLGSAMLGTLATDGSILLITMITGILAARFLLPEGRGALAAVLFWPQLLGGLGRLSLEEAATYRAGMQTGRTRPLTSTIFWLELGLAGVTMIGAFYLIPFLLSEERAHLAPMAQIYLLAFIPFNFIALGLQATDQGSLRFFQYNSMRLLVTLTYLVGLVSLWAVGQISVGWVAAVNCASAVIMASLLLAMKRREILQRPSLSEASTLLKLALRFHPASVLLFLADQADRMFVLFLWDDVTLGYYVVALTIASAGLAVVTEAFHKVLFPHLANVRERAAQAELIAKGLRHAMLLLVGLSVLLAMAMPWLILFLFGEAYSTATTTAWILVCAYIFIALKTILIRSLRGLGEGQLGAVGAAISLGVFLVLAIPLGQSLGLAGMAIALGLANVFAVGYLLRYLRMNYEIEIQDMWGLNLKTINELWAAWLRISPLPSR